MYSTEKVGELVDLVNYFTKCRGVGVAVKETVKWLNINGFTSYEPRWDKVPSNAQTIVYEVQYFDGENELLDQYVLTEYERPLPVVEVGQTFVTSVNEPDWNDAPTWATHLVTKQFWWNVDADRKYSILDVTTPRPTPLVGQYWIKNVGDNGMQKVVAITTIADVQYVVLELMGDNPSVPMDEFLSNFSRCTAFGD
jgi:hypothetical protein